MFDLVTLTVNNRQYGGWKSVRVESGLERMARSFEIAVTTEWPAGIAGEARRIVQGDLVEIRIGTDLVLTGYVDAKPRDYNAHGFNYLIKGRSKTADLVDCSADVDGGQFQNMPADVIAEQLAGQYGLKVIKETATGAALTEHQIQQGETVFNSLDRLANQRQFLVTDNGAGDVVIVSPGSGGRAASALVLGENILAASAGFDYSEVYSTVKVKGQMSGGQDAAWSDQSAAGVSQSMGVAHDATLKRQRVLIVRQSGQADAATCQNRADYEQQIRLAKANEVRYTVAGWRQGDGTLWRGNQTVYVRDEIMELDRDMLISEVIYSVGDEGLTTVLVVIPPAAFATLPDTQTKAAKRTGVKHQSKAKAKEDLWID